MPNRLRHPPLKSVQLPRQAVRQLLQRGGIDGDANEFHIGQYGDELQLKFAQVRELPPLLQVRLEELASAQHCLRTGTGLSCPLLASSRRPFLRRQTKPVGDQVLEIVGLPVE